MSLRHLLATVCLSLASSVASAAPFTQVIAFGDSLSDTGRLLALSGGQLPQPSAYWQGRFSNGAAAVEHLADRLGLGLTSFAVGGATSGLLNNQVPLGSGLEVTGMRTQVSQYLSGPVDGGALYFLWAGANDFLNPAGDPNAVAQAAIGNLTQSVVELYSAGAREFMLPLMADLGLTPRALALGSGTSQQLSLLSQGFNAGLSQAYAQLETLLPGARLRVFDTAAAQHELLANAAQLGFSETAKGCFSGFVGIPGDLCANPDEHLFWDDIHPSARLHELLAAGMQAQFIPLPGSIALAVLALGLLGAAQRRRQPV